MIASFIIFDTKSKIYLSKGELRYSITSASVRCLDRNLHSFRKLKFTGRSILTSAENAYDDKWISYTDTGAFLKDIYSHVCKNTKIIVWKEDEKVLEYLNQMNKIDRKVQILRADELLENMLFRNGYEAKSLSDAMELLSLKYDTRKTTSEYDTDALTRLFRKMYRVGTSKTSEKFAMQVSTNMIHAVSKYEYFNLKKDKELMQPTASEEQISVNKMVAFFEKNHRKVAFIGEHIVIETNHASWWIFPDLSDKCIHYFTKRFYQGERKVFIKKLIPDSPEEICRLVISIIDSEENMHLCYSVGNVDISHYVQKISERTGAGTDMAFC